MTSTSSTTTATVITDEGYEWTVAVEVAAISDASWLMIDTAVRELVRALMDGRGYAVEVSIPDHPALARM